MTDQSNFHPSTKLLEEYALGTLSTGMSVAISAHVELCDDCKQHVSVAEQHAATAWAGSASTKSNGAPDYSDVIASIVSQVQDGSVAPQISVPEELHTPEHSVVLPRVLAKVAAEGLAWKKLAGGINQARVELDNETQCEFIYMKPGSKTPVHTHMGSEVTLVLDGSFSDEMGEYGPADFVLRDKKDHHQPCSDEGCLCFAVLDSPLTFTKGLARLFNPLIRYKFRRATSAGI